MEGMVESTMACLLTVFGFSCIPSQRGVVGFLVRPAAISLRDLNGENSSNVGSTVHGAGGISSDLSWLQYGSP